MFVGRVPNFSALGSHINTEKKSRSKQIFAKLPPSASFHGRPTGSIKSRPFVGRCWTLPHPSPFRPSLQVSTGGTHRSAGSGSSRCFTFLLKQAAHAVTRRVGIITCRVSALSRGRVVAGAVCHVAHP